MSDTKPKNETIQIKGLDPTVIKQIRVYEAEHGMNHAELLTRAFQVLIAQDTLIA